MFLMLLMPVFLNFVSRMFLGTLADDIVEK